MTIKALIEKRNALIAESEEIVNSVSDGSFTAEQTQRISDIYSEVKNLTETIDKLKELKPMSDEDAVKDQQTRTYLDDAHSLAKFLQDPKNTTSTMTQGGNGAVIPSTIADKIMDKVSALSDIYAGTTKYPVKGSLSIPIVDASDDDITVAFVNEGSAPDPHVNSFGAITLAGETYAAIVKVTKKFINNSDIAVVDFLVNRLAEKLAEFIENVIFNGYKPSTDVVIKGIAYSYDSTNMLIEGVSSVTLSELIALKNLIPQKYRSGARWYMTTATKTLLEQMTDTNNRPLLQPDPREGFSDRLFGLPVKESDKVGEKKIYIAVPDGIAVKEPKEKEIAVDESVYRPNAVVGVFLYGEIDTCVENVQKVALYTFQ